MRKNKTYFLCLLLTVCAVCQAQKLSVKPYILYHQSILSQDKSVFRFVDWAGFGFSFELPNSSSNDFTLTNGLEYGIVLDYNLRNNLIFGLNIGYFSNMNNSFSSKDNIIIPSPENPPKNLNSWDYRSMAIRPMFGYAVVNCRSTFIGKIGPSIHLSTATIEYGQIISGKKETFISCTFDSKLCWGYSTGIEYNYQLSKRLNLAAEMGFEQYSYTPEKAKIDSHAGPFITGRESEEIIYVDRINGEQNIIEYIQYPYHYPFSQYHPHFSQIKKLKKTILFNSIYFEIGIKYNLWEK